MNAMIIGMKNELFKLSKKRKMYWIIGILVCLSLVSVIFMFFFERMTGASVTSVNDMVLYQLRQMTGLVLPLFTAMIAIDLFTGEFAQATMKNTLLVPLEKYKVYFSKILALLVTIGFMTLTVYGVTLVSSAILLGLSGLSGALLAVLSYVGAVIPLFLIGILASMLGLVMKSSSSALTISILLYVALNIAGTFISRLSIYLPTSYMEWYRFPIASNTFLQMLLFMIAYIIMIVSVSVLYFERKEV